MKLRRKDFFKTLLTAGVAGDLFSRADQALAAPGSAQEFRDLRKHPDYKHIKPIRNKKRARVVGLTDPACVSDDYKIDEARARSLTEKTLLEFTGKSSLGAAARSLIPNFRKDLRVSIKLNTASSIMPSHPVVAFTLARALVAAGLNPENIILWERSEKTLRNAGYEITQGPGKIKVIGTDTPGYGYDRSKTYDIHGVPMYMTSILTKHSDFQINHGVLKHHWFTGVAVTLKNHYGSIPLLDRVFLTGGVDIARIHLNACDPYITKLNQVIDNLVPTILFVCDALLGSYNNGPLGPPQWPVREMWFSNDGVALDTIAMHKVERKRKAIGLPSLMNKAMFLRTSAKMGLGTNNFKNMDLTFKQVSGGGRKS